MVTHFDRRPGNGKQRGALGTFDNMFGSQPSTASAAQHSSSHGTGVLQSNLSSEFEFSVLLRIFSARKIFSIQLRKQFF